MFTGTRADYGLLYWLMRDLKADPAIRLQVLATGTHMSPAFGMTREAIEADGFQIDEFIEILIDADTPTATATAMGLGLMKFGDAFSRLRPHLLIILGDRFEALAAAAAAVALRIPIAHIHGGEATEGQIDEQIRHAITKLSHLHFTAAAPYSRRVLQMGEIPEHVFDVGALGVDNLTRLRLLDRAELEARLDVELGSLSFLVTYHPVTLRDESPEKSLVALFDALESIPRSVRVLHQVQRRHGRTHGQSAHRSMGRRPSGTCACRNVSGDDALPVRHAGGDRRDRKFIERHHRSTCGRHSHGEHGRPAEGPVAGSLRDRLS